MPSALQGLWAAGVQGLNVTVPHKETVLPLVKMDEDARVIGAVNTLLRTETGWLASNTDWRGFAAVLQGMAADIGSSAMIFGAGGTAKAVIHALKASGVQKVYICNRSEDRVKILVEHVKENYPGLAAERVEWEQARVDGVAALCPVVINTTAIGLKGEAFPFVLSGGGIAIDAVYRPDGLTAFCDVAHSCGRHCVDGLPMLIAQGAASFELWHNVKVPDRLETLRRVERLHGRKEIALPGWERKQ